MVNNLFFAAELETGCVDTAARRMAGAHSAACATLLVATPRACAAAAFKRDLSVGDPWAGQAVLGNEVLQFS